MQFIEWNKIISSHFFNHDNAGKNTYLYITKTDILQMAIPFFNGESEQKIWEDFLDKIENGDQDRISKINIIERSIGIFEEWEKTDLNLNEDIFPPYIIYLAFLVLPLIEIQGEYNSNNYYDRLDNFLTENNIKQNLRNRLREIDILWKDLANWANIINNGELGLFHIKNFINPKWIYVGKIFSQFVFPPRAIRKLPIFFLQSEMIPNSIYTSENCKRDLIKFGASALMLSRNIIDIIRSSDTNELGQSIIEIVKKEYKKWDGESHSLDEDGKITKRNYITKRLYSQFKIYVNEGKIEFSYRMKSLTEFPDNLNFEGVEIYEEIDGYSQTINDTFRNGMQLTDNNKKWNAKFHDKDVRLFINAGSLRLSTDYWIETDTLSKNDWMYLLCKNSKREKIFNWLKGHCSRFENELKYINLPDDYSLFKFLNPKTGLDEIEELTIFSEKSIRLSGAFEVNFRTFTNDILPQVEILNSDGSEEVFLQYKNSTEEITLIKLDHENKNWKIPNDVLLNTDFNVRVSGEFFEGNKNNYRIISSDNSAKLLDKNKLPKRNSFGIITKDNSIPYSLGSNIVGADIDMQTSYRHLFKSVEKEVRDPAYIPKAKYSNTGGNALLSFLTLKKSLNINNFIDVFNILQTGQSINKKSIKSSLELYDYLGYLDYEYETKSIVISPPQFIYIPANKGRKILLIGGRDELLVKEIISTAPRHSLQVEIVKQFDENKKRLLPDAVTVKSFSNRHSIGFGENQLIDFASELKIEFSSSDLVQVGLQLFCNNIEEYEKDLYSTKEAKVTYEDFDRKIFNIETLHFENSSSENFDKSFTLVEPQLRDWEYYYRLWVNQKCYDIDRNWGKYIVLKHFSKNVILLDRIRKMVAIPTDLPLPRLLAESILLLSGIAPKFRIIEERKYRIYNNIDGMFTNNLFNKLGQKPREIDLA